MILNTFSVLVVKIVIVLNVDKETIVFSTTKATRALTVTV